MPITLQYLGFIAVGIVFVVFAFIWSWYVEKREENSQSMESESPGSQTVEPEAEEAGGEL